jgi:pimeloyl-ACP methyl ester carboxylesterase
VLVPGYWLGAWAWEDTVRHLQAAGLSARPVTLPGLDSPATNRATIRLHDHVDAVLEALESFDAQPILVAHSGAGAVATAVLDTVPDRIARVIYVECGPVVDGAIAQPELAPEVVELPLPPLHVLETGGASLEGLDTRQRRVFRERAIPHPAGPLREAVILTNRRRNGVPATLVCCSIPSATVRRLVADGNPAFKPLAAVDAVDYIDLRTGHWPMWSRPTELAEVVARCCNA